MFEDQSTYQLVDLSQPYALSVPISTSLAIEVWGPDVIQSQEFPDLLSLTLNSKVCWWEC